MTLTWIPCNLLWQDTTIVPVYRGPMRDEQGNESPELLAWHALYLADKPRVKAASFRGQFDKTGTLIKLANDRILLIGTGGLGDNEPANLDVVVAYAVLDFPCKVEE